MYAQVEKQKENKSRAVANSVTQKKSNGNQGFGFVDNRPEAVAQRKLQKMANNIPKLQQLEALPIIKKSSTFKNVSPTKSTIQLAKKKPTKIEFEFSEEILDRTGDDSAWMIGAKFKANVTTDNGDDDVFLQEGEANAVASDDMAIQMGGSLGHMVMPIWGKADNIVDQVGTVIDFNKLHSKGKATWKIPIYYRNVGGFKERTNEPEFTQVTQEIELANDYIILRKGNAVHQIYIPGIRGRAAAVLANESAQKARESAKEAREIAAKINQKYAHNKT